MCRQHFWFAALVILAGPLVPTLGRGEEPRANVVAEGAPKKKQMVFIEVYAAEVSVSKLRALGFNWDDTHSMFDSASRTDHVPRDMISFLEALRKDDLIHVLSEPRLATMSGRAASLQVGDVKGAGVRLDVVPQVLESQNIQLEYRIELNVPQPDAAAGENGDRKHSARQFVLDSATELVPGKACCVSETRARRTNERGKSEETVTVVLIRADLKPPAEIRTAEKPSPPKPMLERRYPAIEIPKRR